MLKIIVFYFLISLLLPRKDGSVCIYLYYCCLHGFDLVVFQGRTRTAEKTTIMHVSETSLLLHVVCFSVSCLVTVVVAHKLDSNIQPVTM